VPAPEPEEPEDRAADRPHVPVDRAALGDR
jgi:hypothetical protein